MYRCPLCKRPVRNPGRCSDCAAQELDRDVNKEVLIHHVEVLTPLFQCGGRHNHFSRLGEPLVDAVPRMAEEYDRLTAENAELRKRIDTACTMLEKHSRTCEEVESELAAANATLGALRDLCGPNRTISNSTCMKMVDILYPQPKETTDDE